MSEEKIATSTTIQAILGNKRASVYVKWVCVILFLITLVAFMISFITAVDTIEGARAHMKHSLDSFVDKHSIEIYQSVKQNDSDWQDNQKLHDELELALYDSLGMVQADPYRYAKMDENGNVLYYISKNNKEQSGKLVYITLRFVDRNPPKLQASITRTITVPVTFMGETTVWVDVPITIVSEFAPKFENSSLTD